MQEITVIGMEQALSSIHQQETMVHIMGLFMPLFLIAVCFMLLRDEDLSVKIVGGFFSIVMAALFAYAVLSTSLSSQTAKEVYALQDRTDQIEKVYVSEQGTIAFFEDGSYVECKGWETMENPSGDGSIILDIEHKRVLH